MLNSFLAFFNRISLNEIIELRKPNLMKNNNIVYRDELINNKYPLVKRRKLHEDGNYCSDQSSEPLLLIIKKEEEEEEEKEGFNNNNINIKGVIRVKVKMTKQQAARMLSKCKDGGVLEFHHVVSELVNIPTNCVTVLSGDVNWARPLI